MTSRTGRPAKCLPACGIAGSKTSRFYSFRSPGARSGPSCSSIGHSNSKGPRSIAARYGLTVYEYEGREKALESDWLIVCGANILEPAFANSGKIINAHAGLIPASRGLDSFEWAILRELLLGNTLHVIDEQADAGRVLHHLDTPVYPEDDMATLARRHYQNEIWLLQNFDRFIEGGCIRDMAVNAPTMRMPTDVEPKMLRAFDAYKDRYAAA